MGGVAIPDRRTLAALAAVGAVLAGAYALVPHPAVQYGAWLVVFAVWMGWFVSVAAEWIADADF
ncbi:hypothetical protein BRC90_08910 [Halobacteriales archaeon QS_4_69_34]|nr:MAG: hypothetical protein BRC90_08910 [Halobacteriales archaeon QS_4_69_34]